MIFKRLVSKTVETVKKPSQEASIVDLARKHYEKAVIITAQNSFPEFGKRWDGLSGRAKSKIQQLNTAREVVHAAQGPSLGFESRRPAEYLERAAEDIEVRLSVDFPHFSSYIQQFCDSDLSLPESLLVRNGQLVSWPMYTQVRVIMRCLSHISDVNTLLEIGGGTGGPARLWLVNPIRKPLRYVIVDIPESLFFSEVFLRHHFGNDKVSYIYSQDDVEKADDALALLVPIAAIDSLNKMSFDLILNHLSMQEMSEEWVDYYMSWLDRVRARYFYSLNYFAPPLDSMHESVNTWSPRPSGLWSSELLLYNSHRAPRSFAESLYSSGSVEVDKRFIRELMFDKMSRALTQQTLLELMDCVRILDDDEYYFTLANHILSKMPYVPRELYYIVARIRNNESVTYNKNANEIEAMMKTVKEIRSRGPEAGY
ncbi:MAG: putative sugar O-methyltransferase [Desulfarculaceae bacterium]|nr:putative sugar O-methyltransferase [Desulfarculaceae bacterium]MCF8072949.1 putative sugar O-methyltransferase [Desulfarculaceae bacterium]MCF8115496.1 putative sugar O-methyltransferase [Desulfarculaceae bacterium]